MKTKLLRLVHHTGLSTTVLILTLLFLLAVIRAEAPVIQSELPQVTDFLSTKLGYPLKIDSVELRWRHFLPVLDLDNIQVLGKNPITIGEIKLGTHFILFKNFNLDLTQYSNWNDSSGYFRHIILEDAVINYQDYSVKISKIVLRKSITNTWSWNSDETRLGLGKLFLKPIVLDDFSGNIFLTQENNQMRITANKIKAQNSDFLGLAKLELIIPENNKSQIYMDLKARYEINKSAASHLKYYLPVTLLSKDLFQWLSQSIKSIKSAEGLLILKGNLADFPFDKTDSLNNPVGKFLVDANIEEGKLDYYKNWPPVENINAELIFENTKMLAHVHSATIAHSNVKDIEVEIPELDADKGILNISGNMTLPVENGLYFLHNSPLQNSLGKKFNNLRWTGPMNLGLKLHIPLGDKSPPLKVQGNMSLTNTKLIFSNWNITLDNLTGDINFTENNFSSPKLTGQYMNSPVNVVINPKDGIQINYKKLRANIMSLKNNLQRVDIQSSAWKGHFIIPENFQKMGIKGFIDYLDLNQELLGGDKDLGQIQIKPSSLPPLSIKIANINYKKIKINSLYFLTGNLSNGVWLKRVYLSGPGYVVDGVGKWLDNKQANISGKLLSTDLARMISSWGLQPSIQGNHGEINFQLGWPGVIYSPDFSHMAGTLEFNINKGQILTSGSEAKMNFGRLITLLSFQSLQRRLTLDFSDLTKKGFSFDNITGFIILDNHGSALLKNFILKSAVANVQLLGNINLTQKIYNLTARVTPNLTSSLPLVATIAGGPVAGAAVWAASKVVNPLLDKVTEDDYSVTGPWDNPVIKKGK